MMRWLILGLVTICSASPALADPLGFGPFAWGSSRDLVSRQLGEQCSPRQTLETFRVRRILCYNYRLEGVGPVLLTLEFADGGLQGYRLMVPERLAGALRTLAQRQLGAPMDTWLAGAMLSWDWPSGDGALFDQRCLASEHACLTVRTPKIVRAGLDGVEPKAR
jgi:hypothetical protein